MIDVYKRLANRLDQLPNGFPATDTGVELKILQKIFDPDEAEMALKLKPTAETVDAIAQRLKRPIGEVEPMLDSMAKKGQIWSEKKAGRQAYELYPFVIGIWEFQVNRLDKELSDLMAQYSPVLGFSLGKFAPGIMRVVPINAPVESEHQILRYEEVSKLLEDAKTFQVLDCICRKNAALKGNPCDHTQEICLGFSAEEGAFDKYPLGRLITKQEALGLLTKAEEEGLVHQTYNSKSDHFFICNCCSCCCPILGATKNFGLPYLMAKSNFVALIDQDTCEECGTCADERCPMDAVAEDNGGYGVKPDRCIGCGVCTTTCPTDSISLIRKPESQRDDPPASLHEWYAERAKSRGIPLMTE
jgi:H+/Na+-translocating ferredoxin:NAD+ oxidoreductase subunit B